MNKKLTRSLAAVLPRYGESLGGGAEALVKSIVEELAFVDRNGESLIDRVEVWTTCAKDHRTWENELPAEASVEAGITVRRFPVDKRNIDTFLKHEIAMREGRPLTVSSQLEWLSSSVNSQALYQHIAQYGTYFDVLLFAPYLFATTFFGSLIYPDRSLIIPCLHNEHYAYQGVFRFLFERVRGLIFNSQPERELAAELYDIPRFEERSSVVGMGFVDSRREGTARAKESVRAALPAMVKMPYLLYSGRKETGKNLDLLISCFERYKQAFPASTLQLVIIGAGEISYPGKIPAGVIDCGFVSEAEKQALMEQALCLCQPSLNESFSIVMMESWLSSTPVLVHGDCSVTKAHVMKSGGGLYFTSPEEFCVAVAELEKNRKLRELLGEAGKNYVNEQYCWPAVIGRLYRAFDKFGIRYDETKVGDEKRGNGTERSEGTSR